MPMRQEIASGVAATTLAVAAMVTGANVVRHHEQVTRDEARAETYAQVGEQALASYYENRADRLEANRNVNIALTLTWTALSVGSLASMAVARGKRREGDSTPRTNSTETGV